MVAHARAVAAATLTISLMASGCSTVSPALRGAPPASAASTAAVHVRALDGASTTWDQATAGPREKLVVFMTLWCAPCKAEQPAVEVWARAHATTHDTLLVVSGSPLNDAQAMAHDRRVAVDDLTVWVDSDGAVAAHYGVEAAPTFLRLAPDGRVLDTWHNIIDVRVEAPDSGLEPVTDSGEELGTSYDVVLLAPPSARARATADLASARALVHALDARLSEWRPDSEVSRINRLASQGFVALAPDLRQLLTGALHVSTVTDGAFDITWRPLGDLWRDAMVAGVLPQPAALAEVLTAVGSGHLRLDARGVAFNHPQTRIGVAGVAKGWIIDALWRHLTERGYSHVIVNIGGDLRTSGRQADGSPQTFQIADPYNPGQFVGAVEVGDTAIATSGNYARVREVQGRRVGHILDPRTGQPPAFDGSVTVMTRDAAMADALATGLFVLGPDLGLALVARTPGLEAIYVTRQGVRSSLPDLDGRPLAKPAGRS